MTADTTSFPLDPDRERVRLVSVETEGSAGSGLDNVTVTLEAADERTTVIRSGGSEEPAGLRPVAEATLEALGDLLPGLPGLELLGVERVLATGMDVVLVSVEAPDLSDRSLVGATPVEERDGPDAAASATLDAINRLLGRVGGDSD